MQQPRLLDQVRDAIRLRHYSLRTEQAYIGWIKRYIYFHDKKHPNSMGESEITKFLSYLATKRKVSDQFALSMPDKSKRPANYIYAVRSVAAMMCPSIATPRAHHDCKPEQKTNQSQALV